MPRSVTEEAVIKTMIYWKTKVVDIRWYTDGKPTSKGFRCNMAEAKLLARVLQKIISDKHENKQEFDEEETQE